MPNDGFAKLFRHLERLVDDSPAAVAAGLRPGASGLENRARASTAYEDDTGATREGTVAYVIGGGVDDSGIIETAADLVEDKNPGTSFVTDAGSVDDDEVAVILTVPTKYDEQLELRAAHLAPALDGEADALTKAAVNALRKLF